MGVGVPASVGVGDRDAAEPLPRPVSEARSRNLEKDWDRNYVHSLDWRWLTNPLNDGPGESWIKPTVNLVNGEAMTPCVLAGPTCDSADVLYEKLPYPLPVTLEIGDKLLIEGTGAYTSTYSSVAFNGIPPLKTYHI